MAYKLDITKSTTLQISNDAFWYLYQDDDMIDEANMEEADEVMSMFPNGFIIKDDYEIVDDEDDLIECTFIPYIEDIDISWDGESRCYNSNGVDPHIIMFKISGKSSCYIRFMDERDGTIIYEGECKLEYRKGNPWCIIPNYKGKRDTIWPLWGKYTKYIKK